MASAVTVRDRISDPTHIELSQPLTGITGTVEVVLRVFSEPENRRSIVGLGAKFGPAPSAEEIQDVRREMWSGFPRDDIA